MINTVIYVVTFVIILAAFFLIRRNFVDLKNHDEGTDEMEEIAGIYEGLQVRPLHRALAGPLAWRQ